VEKHYLTGGYLKKMENILTDSNFDETISATDKFFLVDFFATWCGPCSVLGPILEKVAEEFKDKVILLKVDVDQFPISSQKFGIDKIPSVFIFKNGKSVSNFVGLIPENQIKDWVANTIKENS
jgi:thioredoxin 1